MSELFDNPTTEVANHSGRSQPTVSKFFKEVVIRQKSWLSCYESCLVLVEKQEAKLKKLYEKSNKLINKNESTITKEQ
ncbi:hypothetical protein [Kordia sp.]|uniref:hypothetical protein n=1 Tax=Kordia sp. TaxID=1965332 RepID=UPI003D2CCB8C